MDKHSARIIIIICLMSVLIILNKNVSAQCNDAISCEKCVSVSINIIPSESPGNLYVGDSFYYNISITGLGTDKLNRDFRVDIYNPNGTKIGERIFEDIEIGPKQATFLIPLLGDNSHNIFFFDLPGSYKIVVESNDIVFYRLFPPICNYNFHQNRYIYYFDVMPRWEFDRDQNLNAYQEEVKGLTEQTKNLTEKISGLTISLIILTIILVIIQVWDKISKYRKEIIGIELIIIFLNSFYFILTTALVFGIFFSDLLSVGFFILLTVGLIFFLIVPTGQLFRRKKIEFFPLYVISVITIVANVVWGTYLLYNLSKLPEYNTIALVFVIVSSIALFLFIREDVDF